MSKSVYTLPFPDENALVFTPGSFADNDASDALQAMIYRVIDERTYGVLYIAEGTYPITKTIYIPRSVRLIGFGATRPVFVLPANTPGFDGSGQGVDRGHYNSPGYPNAVTMFWFTSNRPTDEQPPMDATAGTFYSAMANVDFRIESGNPMAVCIRAHFAQNAFVSHVDFHLGDGLSALYEVGNEMENLNVYGGQYGILCRQTSPSWPFVLMDSSFIGQKKAAIASRTTGMTMFRITVKDTPYGLIPFGTDYWEKIYMEDSVFENVKTAVVFDLENNSFMSVNMRRIYCRNVPVLAEMRESGKKITVSGDMYKVNRYIHGAMAPDMAADAEIATILEAEPLTEWLSVFAKGDIPALPHMSEWVSVKTFGAVGDGETDDTEALRKAAASGKAVFFPEGWYLASDIIKMAEGTQFIGMSPISTQIILADDTPAFAGFGTPLPLLETSAGFNLIYCLGIDTAGKNPRAVGIKWLANAESYLNDVKFVGGHGKLPKDGSNAWFTIYNASRTADGIADREWDYQYASLWITDGGGGIFKNVWSASPYAESGITITNTSTPGKIYCTSLEHHVRHELKMRNVQNWEFHALQTEEEKAEGLEALPIEMTNCKNILFANLWLFRTVYVHRPYPHAIQLWNCQNIEFANAHNYTQMQYTFDNLIYDPVKNLTFSPWEVTSIFVKGNEQKNAEPNTFTKIIDGLGFGSGAAVDSKGNLVFCDHVHKRIYRYLAGEKRLELLCDLFWRPMCAVFDSQDNLVIVADVYDLRTPGKPAPRREGYHPYYQWFGPRGAKVYTLNPDNPYNTMQVIEPVAKEGLSPETIYHPAHAWTPDTFIPDTLKPLEGYYMLPDGKTAIAATRDIGRSLMLKPATPGGKFLAVDDAITRTWEFDVAACGSLQNPQIYSENVRHNAPDRVICTAELKDGIALICRGSVWICPIGNQIRS